VIGRHADQRMSAGISGAIRGPARDVRHIARRQASAGAVMLSIR
jgi:hypothetical protein